MVPVEMNFVAVLAAAVASMVVGFLWYSPMLFAKPWMKLMGFKNEKEMKGENMMKTYGVSFITAIITAFVFNHMLNVFETTTIMMAVEGAFWTWLGFIATIQLTDVLFAGKPMKLYLINTGYQLASLIAMGIVLVSL